MGGMAGMIHIILIGTAAGIVATPTTPIGTATHTALIGMVTRIVKIGIMLILITIWITTEITTNTAGSTGKDSESLVIGSAQA